MSDETNLPAVKAPQELSVDDVVGQLRKVQELMKRAMVNGEDYGVIPGTKKPTLLKPGAEKLLLMVRLDPQYEAKVERYQDGPLDGVIAVISTCTLFHITSGNRMGSGMGACDSTERGRERAPFNTILKIANKRALVAAVLNVTGASQIFTQDMEDGGDEAAVGDGGRRKASGRGAQSPPPARPGPDEMADVRVRAAFWKACCNAMPKVDAEAWIKERLAEFGLTDAKQLKVGQIKELYQKLEAHRSAQSEPLGDMAGQVVGDIVDPPGPDAGIGEGEPDLDF